MSVIIDLTCLWRAEPVRRSKPIRARPGLLLANPLASCSPGRLVCPVGSAGVADGDRWPLMAFRGRGMNRAVAGLAREVGQAPGTFC